MNHLHITRRTALTALGAGISAVSLHARAEAYPTKPITIVVPFTAGGGTDIIARVIAENMATRLGQPVLVENRPGASGTLGTDFVAKAKPDGHTLVLSLTTSLLSNQFLYKRLPYNPLKDLTRISQIATGPTVIVVNPARVPVKTGPELLQFIAANKGKLSYGSWGAGSGPHLFGAYISRTQNADMNHIPYKGEGPMIQDLVGGQIDMAICSALMAKGFVESGRLTAIAVTGDARIDALPTVPTMREQGVKDDMFKIVGFVGLAGPAGLSRPIVEKLSAEVKAIVQIPAARAKLTTLGLNLVGRGPEEFNATFLKDAPVWEQLVRISGAQLD